ncbi:MAG: AAA family ATPase [Isosphaeraceae bacterium]|nr:AAA family ATPase [Isosphaeraceae bacterium]
MSSNRPKDTLDVLEEIVEWSGNRPEWQRDALRRIVEQECLAPADIDELYRLCCDRYLQSEPDSATVPIPLSEDHIPARQEGPGVSLLNVSNLEGVNRIPNHCSIDFGNGSGLVVIYGDNGAGKSGYVRVIKHACRTRGKPRPILPDAFAQTESRETLASALIQFKCGGTTKQSLWVAGRVPDPDLSKIFVFDTDAAEHYVKAEDKTAFTPRGLDVLEKLANVTTEVGRRLEKRKSEIDSEIDSRRSLWRAERGSEVADLIDKLDANTTTSKLDELAVFDKSNRTRLRELEQMLEADPSKRASATLAARARIVKLHESLRNAITALSDERIADAQKALKDRDDREAEEKRYLDTRFDDELPGTDGGKWKSLWMAAKEYSTVVYSNSEFPQASEGALCILCQQPLDAKARARFQRFDEYLRDRSQELAEEARRKLREQRNKVVEIQSVRPSFDAAKVDVETEVGSDSARGIEQLIEDLEERRSEIRNVLDGKAIDTTASPLRPFDYSVLESTARRLQERAEEERSLEDSTERKRIEAERRELLGRKWLSENREDVEIVLKLMHQKERIAACLKTEQVITKPITQKNKELIDHVVTQGFIDAFKNEISALGLKTLKAGLERRGTKGIVTYGARLEGADAAPSEVASEGERRCLALAMFLAELSQSSHSSTLVFDDPVSSLDHHHRERIAARLVEESSRRQVIVFTHDVMLTHFLIKSAKKRSVAVHRRRIEWDNQKPGYCKDGLPLKIAGAKQQMDSLEKEAKQLEKRWNSVPTEQNRSDMQHTYSLLRSYIEQQIEACVFNNAVKRLDFYINVKHFSNFYFVDDGHIKRILDLFGKCCEYIEGHNTPRESQQSIPDPRELWEDLEAAKAVFAEIKQRQKEYHRNPDSNGSGESDA